MKLEQFGLLVGSEKQFNSAIGMYIPVVNSTRFAQLESILTDQDAGFMCELEGVGTKKWNGSAFSDFGGILKPINISASNLDWVEKGFLLSVQPIAVSIGGDIIEYKGSFIGTLPTLLGGTYTGYIDNFICDAVGITGTGFFGNAKHRTNPRYPNLKYLSVATQILAGDIAGGFDYNTIFPVLETFVGNFTHTFSNTGVKNNPSFNALKYITGNLAATGYPTSSITGTISFPLLEFVGGSITLSNVFLAGGTGFSSPKLKYIQTLTISSTGGLINLDFSGLEVCNLLTVSGSSLQGLSSFVFNSLKYLQTWNLQPANFCPTVSFPAMVEWGMDSISSAINLVPTSGASQLTDVLLGTIGTLKAIHSSNITITGQALTQSCVDAILALLVSLDGTNGTTLYGSGKIVNLSGGTSATPSSTGLSNKAILQGRGATITTN